MKKEGKSLIIWKYIITEREYTHILDIAARWNSKPPALKQPDGVSICDIPVNAER